MGKQTKDWTPPTDDAIESSAPPVEEKQPDAQWLPPGDEAIIPSKKKPIPFVNEEESEGLGQTDFFQQQKEQFSKQEKPSPKSTGESTTSDQSSDISFIAALKDAHKAFNTPSEGPDTTPSPFTNAVKRGWNLAEQAAILTPFKGKPDEESIKKISAIEKENEKLPASKIYTKFNQTTTVGEALSTFVENPVQIIAELTGESMAAMVRHGGPNIAAGTAIGAAAGTAALGPVGTLAGGGYGAMAGMAKTSLGLEYTGSIIESLKKAGINMSDPESVKKGFEDEELISRARTHALQKSIPIALFDLVSGGLAGRLATRPAKSLLGKIALGAGEFAVQGALGAGGEVAGELVSGEKLQPAAIIGEALGELGTTPVSVGIGLTTLKNPTSIVQEAQEAVKPSDPMSAEVAAATIETNLENNEKVNLPVSEEPKSTAPQDKARQELTDLVASGDVSMDGNKVTILTEKGSIEVKRIHDELEKGKITSTGEGTTVQPNIEENIPGQDAATNTDTTSQSQEKKPAEVQDQSVSEDVKKIETERDAEILKNGKPDLKLELVSPQELVDSKDPVANKKVHDDIKGRYKALRELNDCLWRS